MKSLLILEFSHFFEIVCSKHKEDTFLFQLAPFQHLSCLYSMKQGRRRRGKKENCIFHRSLKTLVISKTDFYVFYFPLPGYDDGPCRFTDDSELCPEHPSEVESLALTSCSVISWLQYSVILWYQYSTQPKKMEQLCDFCTHLNVVFMLQVDTGETGRLYDYISLVKRTVL